MSEDKKRKAYKYRIYPRPHQKQIIHEHFGTARWVYNWAISSRKEHYEKTEKS